MMGSLCVGCQNQPTHHHIWDIDETWAYSDSLTFELDVADTNQYYSMYLVVVHQKEYDYQNLYLNWTIDYPSGLRQEQLFNIDLADKFGQWLGQCSRSSCKIDRPLNEGFRFNELGTHTFTVHQHTRDEQLSYIERIEVDMYRLNKH